MDVNLLQKKMSEVRTVAEALEIKKAWLSEYVLPLKSKIVSASVEDKRKLGILINKLQGLIEDIFISAKENLEAKALELEVLDLSIGNRKLSEYSFNPIEKVKGDLIWLFNNLGFVIESGSEIVAVKDNFEDLCIPSSHPSRSNSETFYLDDFRILRPHCTVNSVQFLKRNKNKNDVVKTATIGYVYRKDDESSRHTHQFSQLDFVWVDRNLNLANLKWFLKLIFNHMFGSCQEYRFRNSYFPFTQPSFEMDMKCKCTSECSICKGSGWIEILGSGMLKKEILKNVGYSDDYEGIAGGFGLERIALIKYGIEDIRNIYENNFEFLKKWS